MAELAALNIGIKDEILKTIEYLRMMGVLIPSSCQWGIGWAHSLLSLAFTARWNPKHTRYVSILLFLKFHLACLLRRPDNMRCIKLLAI